MKREPAAGTAYREKPITEQRLSFLIPVKVPQHPEQEGHGERYRYDQEISRIDGIHSVTLISPSLVRTGYFQAQGEEDGTLPAEIAARKNGERNL
jgi:hypothetical protein